MMAAQEFKIIADGAADLGEAGARENGVDVVPFYVSFDGNTYEKEIEEVEVREFYQKMVDNPKVFPKTSMPSVQDYIDVFERRNAISLHTDCLFYKHTFQYRI